MKEILKSGKTFGLGHADGAEVSSITGSAAVVSKEVVPASEAQKPVFSTSDLAITPAPTADDIRRSIAEGRIAEMTPDLAG